MKNVKSWPWSPCQDSSVPIPAKQSTEEPSIKLRKAKEKHCIKRSNDKVQKHYESGLSNKFEIKSDCIRYFLHI